MSKTTVDPRDLPGAVVLDFLAWVRANDLDVADEEDEALCAAFLEWRMHARGPIPMSTMPVGDR